MKWTLITDLVSVVFQFILQRLSRKAQRPENQ